MSEIGGTGRRSVASKEYEARSRFLAFCVLFGLVLGWLRMKSGSVWPCVVAHAALNASALGVSPFSSFDDSLSHRSDRRPGKIAPWNVCSVSADTSCGPPTRWPLARGIASASAWTPMRMACGVRKPG
ncbi:CPBP family intramembrane glutamic endopeptidase [Nocardia sp. NPDC005366]|uniref:CPBP family intramembrane glutamic endopeptidase n=1 Tax=Nocardia sp. NPDC005366 TaxID=3156878 RepID=UPI0033BF578A